MGDVIQLNRRRETVHSKDEDKKLKRRRETITKKASELRNLCKAEVAVIISAPPTLHVWPDECMAKHLIEAFELDRLGNSPRICNRFGSSSVTSDLGDKNKIAFLDGLLGEIRKRKSQLLQDYGKDLSLGMDQEDAFS